MQRGLIKQRTQQAVALAVFCWLLLQMTTIQVQRILARACPREKGWQGCMHPYNALCCCMPLCSSRSGSRKCSSRRTGVRKGRSSWAATFHGCRLWGCFQFDCHCPSFMHLIATTCQAARCCWAALLVHVVQEVISAQGVGEWNPNLCGEIAGNRNQQGPQADKHVVRTHVCAPAKAGIVPSVFRSIGPQESQAGVAWDRWDLCRKDVLQHVGGYVACCV